VYVSTNSGEF